MENKPEAPNTQQQQQEQVKEKEKKGGFFSKVGNMAQKAAATTAQKIKEGAQATKETLSDPNLGQKIKDKTCSVATSIKEGTIQAGQDIKKGASQLKSDAKIITNNAFEYSKQKGEEISVKTNNVVKTIHDSTEQLAQKALDKTSKAALATSQFIVGKPEEEVKYEQKVLKLGNPNLEDPNAVNQEQFDYGQATTQATEQQEQVNLDQQQQIELKISEVSIQEQGKEESKTNQQQQI